MSVAPPVTQTTAAATVAAAGNGSGPLTLARSTDGRPVVLSILDLAGVGSGGSVGEALASTTELAVTAERLGYHRFWVAEHHGMPAVASAAPAVLLAHLGAHTSSIRLGSGGVMLPNHAPLVVAEQFGTLAALHPGRIDLGLGRAPGSDQLTAHALRRRMSAEGDDFASQVAELSHFLQGTFPTSHPYARILTTPRADVPLYILGSSDYGARLAAALGLPYAFAYHFAGANGGAELALDLYRSQFRPSAVLAEPYSMIGVTALAAPTDEQARYEARAGALSMLLLRSGRLQAIPTPEQAAAYPYRPEELQLIAAMGGTEVVGTPESVARRLADVAGQLGADELLITTRVHGADTRRRSFELLAEQVRAAAGARVRHRLAER